MEEQDNAPEGADEEIVEGDEPEAVDEVDDESTDEPVEAAEAEALDDAPEGAVAEAEEAAVESGEASEKDAEPELYDEDGFPADLPSNLHEYFVDRDLRKDGPWQWLPQRGLDPEAPEVQELAYGLLAQKMSWKQAMFGGTKRVEKVTKTGKRGGVSEGGDGRWFASPMDVVDAAKAWMKAEELDDWRLTRNRSAVA